MSASPDPSQLPDDTFEVVQPGSLEAIARADINQQIATAKQFPRSLDLKKMQGRMIQMAAYSPEAAAECFYCIPRGGLDIYGPSVRLSEIVAYCWGNLYSVSRLVDINLVSRLVTAQSVSWDLEANVKEGVEYTNRITIKGPEGAKTAALAALALAKRNAKFAVVPRLVWWPVYERCLFVARGDVVPLGDRIAKMIKAFSVFGVTLDRILAKFEYENVTQFQESDIPILLGYHTAIKEEAASPEEIFPKAEEAKKPGGQDQQPSISIGASPQSAGTTPSGPGNESNAPRRRGRPPGSGRKHESAAVAGSGQGVASPASNVSHQPVTQSPVAATEQLYGPEAGLPSIAQFPTQEAAQTEQAKEPEGQKDPQAPIVGVSAQLANKLRELLAASNKTEGALMAKLREWGFGKNLPTEPIHLEDYGENTLQQVIERWGNLSTHIR